MLRCFGAGAALSAARQIGAEPRRRAAQEAIITLERQHGQAFALAPCVNATAPFVEFVAAQVRAAAAAWGPEPG